MEQAVEHKMNLFCACPNLLVNFNTIMEVNRSVKCFYPILLKELSHMRHYSLKKVLTFLVLMFVKAFQMQVCKKSCKHPRSQPFTVNNLYLCLSEQVKLVELLSIMILMGVFQCHM